MRKIISPTNTQVPTTIIIINFVVRFVCGLCVIGEKVLVGGKVLSGVNCDVGEIEGRGVGVKSPFGSGQTSFHGISNLSTELTI